MNDGDAGSGGFLSRWSRRKAAARPAEVEPAAPAEQPVLPPIESLGADSDYGVFLARGVGAAVQRQALQKAWTTDAGIAAFRGMADYDWDFNAPGYGALRATDNVAQLLRAVLSPALPEPESMPGAEPESRPGAVGAAVAVPLVGAVRSNLAGPIVQVEVVEAEGPAIAAVEPAAVTMGETEPVRRRHGSALPA